MTRLDVMKAALLAGAALLAALPAQAQDERRAARQERIEQAERGDWRGQQRAPAQVQAQPQARPERQVERQWQPQRQPQGEARGNWVGRRDMREPVERAQARPERGDMAVGRGWGRQAEVQSQSATAPSARTYGADRNATYTAPRDRSYGADARARDWQGQRQAREAGNRQGQPGGWVRPGERSSDQRGWNRGTVTQNDPARDHWRRDRREEWRQERRDDARNYAHGYRDGVRADNRYDRDYRSWNRHHWRNDRRYDWYRYRAANRSIFSLGRYYAPYRNYRYSRISIGFRLGSLFYSNRYWINDPWRYRLPDVYGPYRWVRYYDDALLVDVYSGEVVDVIYDFFW